MANTTCHVISHTHWDREWYLPFELFRLRLVDLVDRLLDLLDADPDYKYFNLDGQGIILEDYLKIRPENEDRLRKYITEGRITIGPWYVLNDEFLVSGESTIRSLLIGHKVVSKFGPVMKVGYLPDQFGNISQMPQILKNFGIDNVIFGRGWQTVGDRKMEFCWSSPDGSKALASLMTFWYNNAQDIPEDPEVAKQWFTEIVNRMNAVSGSEHLLFMNGVDHLEAQYNLGKCLSNINASASDGNKIIHSRLPDYVAALRSEAESGKLTLPEQKGELREDRWSSILAGVLSARIYLKQANEQCMRLLEKYAEPLTTWASMIPADDAKEQKVGPGARFSYPAGELEYAWKLLMENHPHDSICGCSTDEVHAEMEPRFTKVQQLAGELSERAMRYIAERIDNDENISLVVFNTLPWERNDVVRATVEVPLGEPDRGAPAKDSAKDWPALELLDEGDNPVSYTLLSSKVAARNVLHPEKLPMAQYVRQFEIEFIAEAVPAVGYTTYTVRRAEQMPKFDTDMGSLSRTGIGVENGLLDVSLDPSGIAAGLRVELQGDDESYWYTDLGCLEDMGDVGDEYNYVKPNVDKRILGNRYSDLQVTADGSASVHFEVVSDMELPESATPCQNTRSDRTAVTRVKKTVKLYDNIPRIEVETEIDNNSKDHRLRALFPTEAEGAKVSVAGGAFDVIERPLHLPDDWMATNPLPSTFHPLDGWVDVSNGEQGLAVFVDGLREYELYDVEMNPTLAITLLRSVGVLSGGAHIPHVQYTPAAQCLGKNYARYAIYPHSGDWKEAKVWKHAAEYNAPLGVVQVGEMDRTRTIEERPQNLARSYSLMSFSTDYFVLSALKREEAGNGIVVRFWNVMDEEVTGDINFPGAKKIVRSNMAEERIEELPLSTEKTTLTVKGREIITLIVDL